MAKPKGIEGVVTAYVDTKEAARLLGYTLQHTRLLIRKGHLKAMKFGRDWMIERKSLTEFQNVKKQNEAI